MTQPEGSLTLLFHFGSYAEAERVLERLDLMGGLSSACEGHLWDEEDGAGYVVLDQVEGVVLTPVSLDHLEEALETVDSFADVPEMVAEACALLPVRLMSAFGQCVGDVAPGKEVKDEVRTE